MFDIGFLEILVIFILGLVVVGPERLPGTIKTCAIWFSRFKRSIQEARAEFEQQIGADEIRREIHNQQIMDSMRDLGDARKSFEDKVNSLKDDLLAEEESQNAAGEDQETNALSEQVEPSEKKAIQSGPPELASTTAKAAEDEPHEPMIHDESGNDASAIPGRKPVNDDLTTEDNDNNGKQ